MKIRNPFHFLYGLIMGTSVELLKPKRPLLPIVEKHLSESVVVLIGSDKNIGLYKKSESHFLVNSRLEQLQIDQKERIQKIAALENLVEVQKSDSVEYKITAVENVFKTTQYVVDFYQDKILFVDNLFFNCVHPLFSSLDVLDLDLWLETLVKIVSQSQGYKIVPAEGKVGTTQDVLLFLNYLRDLNNNNISYQQLMKNYSDFQEIVGVTSLARNMDIIRGNPEWR